MSDQTPRWHYRFDNYKRAFLLLREAMEAYAERPLSQLEREGIIQRFEYTMELAWKTLKDFLECDNVVLQRVTPGAVIREALSARLISHGDAWFEALDARNRMSHTYNFKIFEAVIQDIDKKYLALFDELYQWLLETSVTGSSQ